MDDRGGEGGAAAASAALARATDCLAALARATTCQAAGGRGWGVWPWEWEVESLRVWLQQWLLHRARGWQRLAVTRAVGL